MRRAGRLLSMLAMLLVALGGGVPTVEAQGKDVEHLFAATLDGLPPAPSPAALARITFAPGSGLSMTANPGPAVHFVEEGGFDVLMLGGGALERAGATTPDQATPVAEGEEFSIAPGDLLVIPANTPFEVYNTGTAPAVALIIEFFARDLTAPLPDGIALEPLVVGESSAVPPGPVTLQLSRITLEPRFTVMPSEPSDSPVLIYIEEGRAGYEHREGEVQVVPDESTNSLILLPAGSAIFEQIGAVSGIRNAGDTPLRYLVLSILPAEPRSATPASN